MLLDIPTRIETERLYLRCYQPGDGRWYYTMSQKSRAHLLRYESNNIVLAIQSEADAETAVHDLAAAWYGDARCRSGDQAGPRIHLVDAALLLALGEREVLADPLPLAPILGRK